MSESWNPLLVARAALYRCQPPIVLDVKIFWVVSSPTAMHLSGSKWNTKKRRRRRSSPWRVALLLLLIATVIYVERVVVPQTPPLFVVTPIPTRSPATIILEADSLFQAGKLAQAEQA